MQLQCLIKNIVFASAIFLFSGAAWAESFTATAAATTNNNLVSTQTQTQADHPVTSANPATMTIYCPDPKTLLKDPQTLKWASKDKQWQSYDVSFVKQLTQFIGAQWNGVALGQVFCLYRGDDKASFPVLVAFHALALVPKTDSWSADLGGYRNCKSNKQTDCGFQVRVRPKKTDIYQEALQLKQDS